jgi:hypothetical protein
VTKPIKHNIFAHVGRRQLGKGVSASTASNTRQARASMDLIIENYRKAISTLEDNIAPAIYNALEPTFEKSKEYCPKDTGALVASGYLEIVEFRGKPRVSMGYGAGGVPDYAAVVHENLEWRHKAPTKAKWLQVAMEEDLGEFLPRVAAQLKFR